MLAKDQLSPKALGAWQKVPIAKWWPMIKAADVKVDRTLEPDTALPSGRTERLGKTLKNQRKSASLLCGCYHVLLPPATPSNVLRLDRQPDGETANEILERSNAPAKRHAFGLRGEAALLPCFLAKADIE